MRKQLGHYEIIGELGRGGMGVVYRAHEVSLNRSVAIKVLAEKVAGDEELVARFLREARSAAALNHPNVIQIYFIGEEEGQHFFVMEFVEGDSLAQIIRRQGRLDPEYAADILGQAAAGLAAAHEKGIVHRDIKPGNIMVDRNGVVKLADFGIAFMPDFGKKLTSTGQFLGTPGYLSPEICTGSPLDHRADIFSLGVVFFEMLTGTTPFNADSPFAMIHNVVKAPIPDVRALNPLVDEETISILGRMVEKDPEDRYQGCGELIDELARVFGTTGRHTLPLSKPLATTAASGNTDNIPTLLVDSSSPDAETTDMVPESEPSAETPATGADVAQPPPVPVEGTVAAAPESKRRFSPLIWATAAVLVFLLVIAGLATRQSEPAERDGSGSEPTSASIEHETEPSRGEPSNQGEAPVETHADGDGTVPPDSADSAQANTETPSAGSDSKQASPAQADGTPAQGGDVETAQKSAVDAAPQVASAQGDSRDDSPSTGKAGQANAAPANEGGEPSPGVTGDADVDVASSDLIEESPELVDAPTRVHESRAPLPRKRRSGNGANRAEGDGPKLAVMVSGDAVYAEPLESAMELHLAQDEIALLDEKEIHDPQMWLERKPLSVSRVRKMLYEEGANVLVLVQMKHQGERELEFMGRTETAYRARVSLRVYALPRGKQLSKPKSQVIEYTLTNAAKKAGNDSLVLYESVVKALESL